MASILMLLPNISNHHQKLSQVLFRTGLDEVERIRDNSRIMQNRGLHSRVYDPGQTGNL